MTVRKVRESTDPPKQAGNRGKGRVKGVPNKATASIRDIARQYTAEAIAALVEALQTGSGPAKVSAAKEILDRGYGKASTVLAGDQDGGPIQLAAQIRLIGVRADAA